MSSSRRILPLILSGGSGSRLWPLSRSARPKQFLALTGRRTLLQETALRASRSDLFGPLTVITGAAHLALVQEQLRDFGALSPRYIVEPMGRDTGAAAAAGALLAREGEPNPLLLIMPADHRIADVDGFLAAVRAGAAAAEAGKLVLFGMKPDSPATGYGYVRAGSPLPHRGVFAVQSFVEKPDKATAERFLSEGGYYWNSGIFLMSADSLLGELANHAPGILEHARDAVRDAARDEDVVALAHESFALCPALSIDRAVMEKTVEAAVVPADFGWTDVGSWSTLWEIGERDDAGNVVVGEVLMEATSNSYIRSEGPIVATVGLSNLIVIVTHDAVLIADKSRDQETRAIVERLKAKDSDTI